MSTLRLTDPKLKNVLSITGNVFTLTEDYTIDNSTELLIDTPFTLIIPQDNQIQLTNGSITNDGILINNGEIIVNNTIAVINNYKKFDNNKGGIIKITAGSLEVFDKGVVNNNGEIDIGSDCSFEIQGQMTNTGTINISTNQYNAMDITKSGSLINDTAGIINIKTDGTLINGGVLTNRSCIINNGQLMLCNDPDTYKSITINDDGVYKSIIINDNGTYKSIPINDNNTYKSLPINEKDNDTSQSTLINEKTGWIKNSTTIYILSDKKPAPSIDINNEGTICGDKLVVSYDNYIWTGNKYKTSCTLISQTRIIPRHVNKIRWAFNNRTGCRYVHSIIME